MNESTNLLERLNRTISQFEILINNSLKNDEQLNNEINNSSIIDLLNQKKQLQNNLIKLLENIKSNHEIRNFDMKKIQNLIKFLIEQIEFLQRIFENEKKQNKTNINLLNKQIEIYGIEISVINTQFKSFLSPENLKSKSGKNILSSILSYLKSHSLNSKFNQNLDEILENLITKLNERNLKINLEQQNALKIRLSKYLNSNNSKKLDLSTLADAIIDYENSSETNSFLNNLAIEIKQILTFHENQTKKTINELRKELMESKTQKPQTIIEYKNYKLVKLISKIHLKEESANSGHCVGTSDHYINGIIKGEIEIYSFRTNNDEFLLTIEFNIKSKTIVQIKKKKNELLNSKENYFKDFLQVLAILKNKINFKSILDLDKILPNDKNLVLTLDGIKNIKDMSNNELVLAGNLKINDENFDNLKKYFDNPIFTINLTNLSSDKKNSIEIISGNLVDKSNGKVIYSKLESVGGYYNLYYATSIELNQLDFVGGYFNLYSAISVELNQLQSVGGFFDLESATSVKLNQLQSVGSDFYLRCATIVVLNKLQTVSGDFDLRSATIVVLNKLQSVGGYFDLENVISIELNQLQSVGGYFSLESATSAKLNQLQSVGEDFNLRNATSVELNKLQFIKEKICISKSNIEIVKKAINSSLFKKVKIQ